MGTLSDAGGWRGRALFRTYTLFGEFFPPAAFPSVTGCVALPTLPGSSAPWFGAAAAGGCCLPFGRLRSASRKVPFVACWCGNRLVSARPSLSNLRRVAVDGPLCSVRPRAQVFCHDC